MNMEQYQAFLDRSLTGLDTERELSSARPSGHDSFSEKCIYVDELREDANDDKSCSCYK